MIVRLGRPCAVLLLCGVAACGPVLQHATPLAEINLDNAAYQDAGYRISRGDQIEIRHLVDPDYNTIATVTPDGRLSVTGVPADFMVEGSTMKDFASQLATLYVTGAHIKDPSFTVNIRGFGSRQIFVGGEVQRPGYMEMVGGERTVMQVLVAAGGMLPTARTKEVLIMRNSVSGKPMIFSVNIRDILSGEDLSQNVLIRPLDVVLVPRSDVGYLDTWVDQYIRQVLPFSTNGSYSYTQGNNFVR